jgi:hypothetical protein
MRLVVSGEGASDMGAMVPGEEGRRFQPGPVMKLLDQLCENILDCSLMELDQVSYVSEFELSALAKADSQGKKIRLPGKKQGQETGFFYRNALALAHYVQQHFTCEPIYPVLFRDSDGTNTSARGEWHQKYQSMLNGFIAGGTDNGIAMLAKPKSEAWFLCALKEQPYQRCDALENESGNDRSPNSLKGQLEARMGEPGTAAVLNQKIDDGEIDPGNIDMPSFNVIKSRIVDVIGGGRYL